MLSEHVSRSPTRSLVIVPVLKNSIKKSPNNNSIILTQARASDERLSEVVGLAQAIELNIVGRNVIKVQIPNPATLFGSGKIRELKEFISHKHVELIIVDHLLSPVQQRNLERVWRAKVIDRTGLILEIFGRRARTREGRVQVELAHLTFERSRLVRSWTHLERQRGGFGFLGGPGESQIETDRRILQARINKLEKDLAKVVKTRKLHRKKRRNVPYPVVAIVGYTNAGKSTLFNGLTNSKVAAKNQVFATLDPTMRALALQGGRTVIISDTVGFISDLPTTLIAAFRATLEEVVDADLILHVRDISHSETEAQCFDVECILGELGILLDSHESRIIEVWNKIDLIEPSNFESICSRSARHKYPTFLISATNGHGFSELCRAISDWFGANDIELSLLLPSHSGRLMSWLHENTCVISIFQNDNGLLTVTVQIAPDYLGRLKAQAQKLGIKLKGAELAISE
ncbi:MAG: GTPase HflX [Hyphomicrobiaceae bacterium hypho_1]